MQQFESLSATLVNKQQLRLVFCNFQSVNFLSISTSLYCCKPFQIIFLFLGLNPIFATLKKPPGGVAQMVRAQDS